MTNNSWIAIAIVFLALLVAVIDHTSGSMTDFYDDSTFVAQRTGLNLISGSGVTVTSADDPTNSRVNYTIARSTSADFAGIFGDDNAVATTINVVDAFEQVTIFGNNMPESTSDGDHTSDDITLGATTIYEAAFHGSGASAGNNKVYEWYGFTIATSGSTITGATQANPAVITAVSHGFTDGQRVKITGVLGMTELNGRIFTVANKADDTFELNDDNGGNINSGAFGAYASGGTATLATIVPQLHTHRLFAGGAADVASFGTDSLLSAIGGETLEIWVKGVTDATDLTIETAQLTLIRVN